MDQALTLVGPNDVRMSIKDVKKDMKYDVEADGCQVKQGYTNISWAEAKVFVSKETSCRSENLHIFVLDSFSSGLSLGDGGLHKSLS